MVVKWYWSRKTPPTSRKKISTPDTLGTKLFVGSFLQTHPFFHLWLFGGVTFVCISIHPLILTSIQCTQCAVNLSNIFNTTYTSIHHTIKLEGKLHLMEMITKAMYYDKVSNPPHFECYSSSNLHIYKNLTCVWGGLLKIIIRDHLYQSQVSS